MMVGVITTCATVLLVVGIYSIMSNELDNRSHESEASTEDRELFEKLSKCCEYVGYEKVGATVKPHAISCNCEDM
jgi:hypothetical protein